MKRIAALILVSLLLSGAGGMSGRPARAESPAVPVAADADLSGTLAPDTPILIGLKADADPAAAAAAIGGTLGKVVASQDGALRYASVVFQRRVPVPDSDMLADNGITGMGRGWRYYPTQAGAASAETYYQAQATSHLSVMEAPAAWAVPGGTGTGATLAMLDTGVTCGHADLQGAFPPSRIAGQPLSYDAIGGRYGGGCVDNVGHGTTTAGLASARVNGRLGLGVAYGARLLPVRVSTGHVDSIDMIEAIIWATENGADVLNMSFGTYLGRLGPDQVSRQAYDISSGCTAIYWAFGKGTITVAASGNDGTTRVFYPAGCDLISGVVRPVGLQVIGVGALAAGSATQRWTATGGGSTRGAADVMAPGEGLYGIQTGGSYGNIGTGTSWSSALAAGCIADAYGAAYARLGPLYRPLIAREIGRRVQDTAAPLGAVSRTQGASCTSGNRSGEHGCGRLDCAALVGSVAAWVGSAAVPTPGPGAPTVTPTYEAGIGGTEEATATATHVPAVLTALATIRGTETPTPTATDDPDQPTPTPNGTQALQTEVAGWLTALAPSPTVDVAGTLTALVPNVPGTLTAIAPTLSARDRAIMTLTARAPTPTGTPTLMGTPTATVPVLPSYTPAPSPFAGVLLTREPGRWAYLPVVGAVWREPPTPDPWGP